MPASAPWEHLVPETQTGIPRRSAALQSGGLSLSSPSCVLTALSSRETDWDQMPWREGCCLGVPSFLL